MSNIFKLTILSAVLVMFLGLFAQPEKAKAYSTTLNNGCVLSFQADNGQYMVAEEGGGGAVNANRPAIGAWERFEVANMNAYGSGWISLRTQNGSYLYAEGGGGSTFHAWGGSPGPWETFYLHDLGGGYVAIETWNGNYVVAEGGGGDVVNADRWAIGPWETFYVVKGSGCGPAPTVDVRANGSNGPISVAYSGSATISWTSTDATSCNVNGNSGTSGSFSTGSLTTNTTYYAECYGNGTAYDNVTVNVNPAPAPTCASATPDGDWVTTGTRAVSANTVTGATSVSFATWSDPGGQDDIVWYPGTQSGSTWSANINLANHGAGTINVHTYMSNSHNTNVYCDSANFTKYDIGTIEVNSNQSSTWTITCSLTNPACPNVPAGSSSTTGSYPSKPQTTWTITPANIAGYTWKVNSCAVNTPCAAGF